MGHTSSMTARPISRSAFLAYVGFLILLAFLVLFNVRLFVTSGPSMEPTYTEGEVLFAVRLYGQPQTGDVVLIQKDGTTYMKRVAYVAGEDVSLSSQEGYWGSSIVPEGYVYVLGDNPDDSYDSRYEEFGLVKVSEIWGKPLSQKEAPEDVE